jgi:hypothetical protein
VGNKFHSISDGDTLLPFDDILERVRSGRLEESHISLQQGVSETQHRTLQTALNGRADVRVTSYFDKHQRCDCTLTHKKNAFNTLISEPIPLAEAHAYASILMIDDACAELSDHVTGKHIQFMVLVEAARQMVNAVTQKFYSTSAKIYLAEDLRVRFKTFVYPFEAHLECRISRRDLRATGDGKMAVTIDIVQQGKAACQLSLAFTVLDRAFVSTLETNGVKALSR